jgi:hypothetical protein
MAFLITYQRYGVNWYYATHSTKFFMVTAFANEFFRENFIENQRIIKKSSPKKNFEWIISIMNGEKIIDLPAL